MQKLNHLVSSVLAVAVIGMSGCANVPVKAEVQEGKFRFENFKDDRGYDLQYVHLMCRYKRPIAWAESTIQYDAGPQSLWIKADIITARKERSAGEAYVHFDVDLAAGHTYTVKRDIKGHDISIWIENMDTGEKITEVAQAVLKPKLLVEDNLRKTQCEQGTV